MLKEFTEIQRVEQALQGPQFDPKLHGGLYDRGSADSYYGRPADPHWYPNGTGHAPKITDLSKAELQEYLAGYEWNEQYGGKKEYA